MARDARPVRVFLSGPVTGLKREDVLASFGHARDAVSEVLGHDSDVEVYSPVEDVPDGASHEVAMLMTLAELTCSNRVERGRIVGPSYDVMVMLPGWRHSEGCRLELACAKAIGVRVVELSSIMDVARGRRDGR